MERVDGGTKATAFEAGPEILHNDAEVDRWDVGQPRWKVVGFVGEQIRDERPRALFVCRLELSLQVVTSMAQIISTLARSEEHTSELQSLMRISYAVFCLKTKTQQKLYTSG